MGRVGSERLNSGSGVNTSDATAVASDIKTDKTAYVNSVKLTGTFAGVDSSDANSVAADIANGKTAYVNNVEITGTRGIDSYTKALLHFDGSNDSTTFTDETGKTWTAAGTAKLSTSQKAYGASSVLFDGDSDFIYTASNSDFSFGADPFTIEMWVYPTRSTTSADVLFMMGSDANNRIQIHHANLSLVFISLVSGSNAAYYVYNTLLTVNTWQHIAFVRDGTNFYLFKNGVLQSPSTTYTAVSTNSMPPNSRVHIGARRYDDDSIAGYFQGNIDEFRISKGIARWTTNFVPGSPYGG